MGTFRPVQFLVHTPLQSIVSPPCFEVLVLFFFGLVMHYILLYIFINLLTIYAFYIVVYHGSPPHRPQYVLFGFRIFDVTSLEIPQTSILSSIEDINTTSVKQRKFQLPCSGGSFGKLYLTSGIRIEGVPNKQYQGPVMILVDLVFCLH